MRKFLVLAGFLCFAVIAYTATGFAGQHVDVTGPPGIQSLHTAIVDHTVDFFVANHFDLVVQQAGETAAVTTEVPAQQRVFADIPPLFALDKVGWRYRPLNIVYDFNHWKEHIKPLLDLQSRNKRFIDKPKC